MVACGYNKTHKGHATKAWEQRDDNDEDDVLVEGNTCEALP